LDDHYGAWSIHGLIRDKWWSLDAEAGVLGYPVTDEPAPRMALVDSSF